MIRLALGALVVWGTMSVAACDQAGNEHQILAATVAAPAPEVRQEFLMPVHATATAQLSGCSSAAGVAVSLNGELALAGLGARLTGLFVPARSACPGDFRGLRPGFARNPNRERLG